MTKSKRRTRDEWTELLEEWRESGESEYQFARARGLSLNQLKVWKRRLADEREPAPAGLEFIELPTEDRVGDAERLEVYLCSGRRLTFPVSLPAERLAAIVGALESA